MNAYQRDFESKKVSCVFLYFYYTTLLKMIQ